MSHPIREMAVARGQEQQAKEGKDKEKHKKIMEKENKKEFSAVNSGIYAEIPHLRKIHFIKKFISSVKRRMNKKKTLDFLRKFRKKENPVIIPDGKIGIYKNNCGIRSIIPGVQLLMPGAHTFSGRSPEILLIDGEILKSTWGQDYI